MHDHATAFRARLGTDLLTARKARDAQRVAVLRTLVAAIDNAGAVPVETAGDPSQPALGANDVDRRAQSTDELRDLLVADRDERRHAAEVYRDAGRDDEAGRLLAEAAITDAYLAGLGDGARDAWNTRHADRSPMTEPARFLTDRAALLPRSGRALDAAGGTGRNAIWLARHGLDTTLTDVSDEACRQAEVAATDAGVALTVERRDLGFEGLPAGRWDVVLFHHYLDLTVWRAAAHALAPGGVLLACQPTVRNLERHDRPSRRWLLEEGRLVAEVADWTGIEVVELTEAWIDEDRHEARLVVRRRPPPS